MNSSGDEESVIDRLLDAGVFAPLGFALTRRETFDELAAAGRKQVAFTRSLGRAAIKGLARGASATNKRETTTAVQSSALEPVTVDVEGYDLLTAREIVGLLSSSDATTARWIQARELAGKNRVTVLRAAARALG